MWAEIAGEGKAGLSNDPLAKLVCRVREAPEEISYARMSLEVAREIWPDLDDGQIVKLETELNQKGDELKKRLEGAQDGQKIVRKINKFIYSELALRAFRDFEPEKENPELFFPHTVLKHKQGACLGLSLVYLSLCERAQIPVYAVHSPQHMYVRYDNGEEQLNIETTERGRIFKEKSLITRQKLKTEELQKMKNVYFRQVDKLEVLGDILNVLCWCSAIQTAEWPLSPERAVLAARLCVEIGEENFVNWDTLAQAYFYAKQYGLALEMFNRAHELRPSHIGSYGKQYWKDRLRLFTEATSKELVEK